MSWNCQANQGKDNKPMDRTHESGRWKMIAGVGLLATVAFGSLTSLGRADAATVTNLETINSRTGADRFKNYDFEHESNPVRNDEVDWPIDLVFYNDASVTKVKEHLAIPFPREGSEQSGRVDDGDGWVWNKDKGMKSVENSNDNASHSRLYGTPNRSYDLIAGYYVVASAHIDHEVLIGSWWGYSERAEHDFAVAAREEWGPGHVDEDLDNFYNANGLHADIDDGESHMWDNDKYATFVDVP